jgi:hypothetical protein
MKVLEFNTGVPSVIHDRGELTSFLTHCERVSSRLSWPMPISQQLIVSPLLYHLSCHPYVPALYLSVYLCQIRSSFRRRSSC